MAIKNFVFRKNRVGRKKAGMKKTNILPPKGPNNEFLKQDFSLKRRKLYYYQFYDFKTD